ncbi:MAG: PEP-CTERM sorting domain-containing protein [Thermoguttaceae bacterium]|jgi:hypothetical protein
MFVRRSLFPALAVLLFASPVLSEMIPIPNGSFEDPTVGNAAPYASPDMSDWQKSPPPSWWAGTGASTDQWYQSVGTFLNVPFEPIDNVDGNQAAFMFSNPGLEISQQLTNTFQVGTSYQLTVGIAGGSYGMAIGCPMEIGLYYLDGSGNQVMAGTTTVVNDATLAQGSYVTHLTDYQLTIPAVAASDPWAGQNIGVALIQTADLSNAGGYWDIDNVRLTATTAPEPGSIALLVAGLAMLVLRRRLFAKQTAAAHD